MISRAYRGSRLSRGVVRIQHLSLDMTAIALDADPTSTTHLAAYLNAAMRRDAAAREAYLATWGVEWSPLGDGSCIEDGASTLAGTVR